MQSKWITSFFIAIALVLVGQCSALFFSLTGPASMMGPLVGFSVGILLTLGARCLVGIGFGAFAATALQLIVWWPALSWSSVLWMAAIIAVGITCQAWASAWLLHRFGIALRLASFPDFFRCWVVIGPLCSLISASFAILALSAGHLTPHYPIFFLWLLWWLWVLMWVVLGTTMLLCLWEPSDELWRQRKWSLIPLLLCFIAGMSLVVHIFQASQVLVFWFGFNLNGVIFLSYFVGVFLYITGRNVDVEALARQKSHALANADSALLLATDEIHDLDRELAQSSVELQNSMARLQDREMRLQAIFNTAKDALVTFDAVGLIEDVNPAAVVLFGYPRRAFHGMNFEHLLPNLFVTTRTSGEFDRKVLINPWRRLVGGTYETEGVRCDLTKVPIELVVSMMEIHGETKFTAIVRDTTERKRLEKIKSEFVSVVSHELRTPLTSLHGSLRLIESGLGGEIPKKAEHLIAIAQRNAHRLIRLVNDLLDLEKIQSGQLRFELSDFDPGSLLHQTLSQLDPIAAEAKVKLTPSVNGPVTMHSDPHRFAQVLVNLISNAIKFSPPDSDVEIRLESVAKEQIRIAVIDRGPGINQEDMPMLFQRFSQIDSTTTRQQGGTGLGLAISKELIGRLGGTIGVDSVPGEGSTFWFSLPVSTPDSVSV